MKLGILDCIPQRFYDFTGGPPEAEAFIALLRGVGYEGDFETYHVAVGEFPPGVDACDAFLLTGSPSSAYEDEPWIEQLKAFVRDLDTAQVPTVGVCFGHQLIAEALGGKVQQSPVGWQAGLYEFEVFDDHPWMGDAAPVDGVKVHHLNKDQVVALPPNATRIATSPACHNMMLTVGDHVLSIQGHPEMTKASLTGFLRDLDKMNAITPAEVTRAHESVSDASPDATMMGTWIRTFIERAHIT